MLQNYTQFVNTQAVKNQSALIAPRVVKTSDVLLPRESVYHYLDPEAVDVFPTREMIYLSNIPGNKRVPILFITDLLFKDETTTVANRTLAKNIRDWVKSNTRKFIQQDLLQTPNTDVQTNSVVDYNALNNLYKYSSTSTSKISHRKNLYRTYWEIVKKCISISPTSHQFVSITVPKNIPSARYLTSLNDHNDTFLARVVTNDALFNLWSLFNFLDVKTRSRSTMSALTDDDTKHIHVELKYNGYSCFFLLSDLISLSSASKLLSKRKINPQQLQKFLIIILFNIQKTVTNLTEQLSDSVTEETDDLSLVDQADLAEDPADDEESFNQNTPTIPTAVIPDLKSNPVDIAKTEEQPEELTTIELDRFIQSGTEGLMDLDTMDFPDEVYTDTIQPASEPETDIASDPIPKPNYTPEFKTTLLTDVPATSKFNAFLDKAKNSQVLSSVEIRALRKLQEKRNQLPSPYDQKQSFDSSTVLSKEDTALNAEQLKIKKAIPAVKDELKKEVLFNFDKQYLNTAYRKDILACVKKVEDGGVVIKDYTVDINRSSLGGYEIHKLVLKPYHGKESSVYFRIPIINSEGEYTASGIRYRMKRSRQDLPIRKVSPIRVALTSNYSKLFVTRSERQAYDPYSYIAKFIKTNYLDEEGLVKTVTPGYSFDNTDKKPNIFASLSRELRGFSTDDYTFHFNTSDFDKYVKPEVLKEINDNKQYKLLTYCGYINSNNNLLVVDADNVFYDYSSDMKPLGKIDTLLKIEASKLPKPFSNVKILGDDIPLGVVMGYYLGLTNLLGVTDTEYTTIPSNKQYQPTQDELVLKFDDYKLILKTDTESKRLLFNGFTYYKDFIKTVPIASLLNPEIYLDILQFRNHGLIHLKEIDMLKNMFVDPITSDVLQSMNMPTSFLELLLKANSMLDDFSHPDINDPTYSRIRGFDRVPGLMYRALSESVRSSKFKGNGRGKIELDPYKVWNYITQDNTVKITEDANPVSDVKEVEAVTFSGLDGISKSATPEALRRFHKQDRGLVSEATVDSSDVGLNFSLSPYAKLKDLRGTVISDSKDVNEHPETIFSTSALLTPFIETDD